MPVNDWRWQGNYRQIEESYFFRLTSGLYMLLPVTSRSQVFLPHSIMVCLHNLYNLQHWFRPSVVLRWPFSTKLPLPRDSCISVQTVNPKLVSLLWIGAQPNSHRIFLPISSNSGSTEAENDFYFYVVTAVQCDSQWSPMMSFIWLGIKGSRITARDRILPVLSPVCWCNVFRRNDSAKTC